MSLVPLTNKYGNTLKNIIPIKCDVAIVVIKVTNTKRELVHFLNAEYYFLVKNTWIKAIKNNNFAVFPRLMVELTNKYLIIEL